MRRFLKIIAEGGYLTQPEAELAMHEIMRGEARAEELAGFLMGLRSRGESVEELSGFTRVMREYAVPVTCPDPYAIDLCGTGGDHANTFNISTTAAFVCAGAGVTVAKHGNRSVSSQSGSADVLEALGVYTELRKKGVEHCLENAGIAFIFAPYFHPAMRHVMPVRKALGVRSFFNILGPMCNPAGVRRQLIGAFSKNVAESIAAILHRLGSDRAVTAHADDGLDEITITAHTDIFVVNQPVLDARVTDPEAFGFDRARQADIQGGDAVHNARILKAVLKGEKGHHRNIVLMNAAYALWTSGKFDDISQAITAAEESIDSGSAHGSLTRLIEVSNEAPHDE